jgi:hypothetical protein
VANNDFSVRVGEEEIGQILNRKENLDHHDQLWDYMSRYHAMGWDLAVVTAQGGADLGLDLDQPKESWWKQLADLGLEGIQLNLGIRTGRTSHLLVLEVNKGEGNLSLDLLGDWRSQCVAELKNCREQHYYALPPGGPAPDSFFLAKEVLIYGEGGLVLAPPSVEPDGKESWRWLRSPWESPPQPPKPAVWRFLREQQAPGSSEIQELPSWDEIFRVVAAYEPVLKALLIPPGDMDKYYRDILQAARAVGLTDRQMLLGLLWNAPQGDARHNPERWKFWRNQIPDAVPGPGAPPPVPNIWPGGGPPPGSPWPGQLPASQPPALASAGLGGSMDLNLGMGELTKQLLGETEPEPSSHNKFEKTVSGQFFQLLAALGEKVISESCRHEAILSGMGAQATELERLVGEIEQCLVPPATGAADPKTAPRPPMPGGPMEFTWGANMSPQRHKSKKLQEVKSMVQDFLSQNPDLAGDQNKVQMVLFCLKNYVSINPDYAGLSFRDKLEKAGQMARSFMGQTTMT